MVFILDLFLLELNLVLVCFLLGQAAFYLTEWILENPAALRKKYALEMYDVQ